MNGAGARYDRIGTTYARYRRPDPRIAAAIARAVGDAATVVDVGSGTGSYEPRGARVVAVEPSETMIAQRPATASPVVRGVAEHMPFADASFDVALALLTVHHWSDPRRGMRELARVSARQIFLTWDPAVWSSFWLVADYVPEVLATEEGMPTAVEIEQAMAVEGIITVPVPWDCTDGFCGAYWRRPEQYLDPGARSAISGLARLDGSVLDPALARLARELEDGTWRARFGALLEQEEADLGYRLVLTRGERR